MTDNTEIEIVLVEDIRSDAEMIIRAIKQANVTNKIRHLKDGSEALDFMFGAGGYASVSGNTAPIMMILDIRMPKVSGIEVLEKIRSNEITKHIPVVMLTSSMENPDIQRCYALGVNGYIMKPVGRVSFIEVVSNLGLNWTLHSKPPGR
jgi:two-component system, response regulator